MMLRVLWFFYYEEQEACMVEQYIQTEFQQILDEYGMEAMIYAFRFEQQITALEKNFTAQKIQKKSAKRR